MHIGAVQNARMADTRPDPAKRLTLARERKGIKTPKEAATRYGWVYETYIQHEQGIRGITRAAAKYAKAYGVSRAWLLTGEGEEGSAVPVVGYVGAGGAVVYDEPTETGDTVPRPAEAAPETVAVAIRGSSLGPGFDRWYALYTRREDPVTENLLGHLCVVGTADGRTLVKLVRRGRGKGYNLVSGTGEIEEDVKLLWGARVIHLHQP